MPRCWSVEKASWAVEFSPITHGCFSSVTWLYGLGQFLWHFHFLGFGVLNHHHHRQPCTCKACTNLEIFSKLGRRWPTSRFGKKSAMTMLASNKKLATIMSPLQSAWKLSESRLRTPSHKASTSLVISLQNLPATNYQQSRNKVLGNCLKAVWEELAEGAPHWSSLF